MMSRYCFLLYLSTLVSNLDTILCFSHFSRIRRTTPTSRLSLSTGFQGGFGGAKKAKPVTKKTIRKRIEKKYGGTSAQDIAVGTERYIGKQMSKLPDHMKLATQLYQQLRQWDARLESMSLLEQTKIPKADCDGANRARQELGRIYTEHNITNADLHNLFQRVTWDASADAKVARSLAGKMHTDLEARINKACSVVASALATSSKPGRCLDVGCGFGTLVPNLLLAGLQPNQIVGVDLSPEMIRNAVDLYPECSFEAMDFLKYQRPPSDGFDCVLFCSALHDLPDQKGALQKASELLNPGGSIVIVHAQGAGHVEKQVFSNPVLVKSGLLGEEELRDLATECGLTLIVAPAVANSPRDTEEGYLAVLHRRS